MLIPILIGLTLGSLCMACHALGTTWWLRRSMTRVEALKDKTNPFSQFLVILGLTITTLTVLHVIEIVLWALGYRWFASIDALTDLEDAVYFSFVTFTTVGYGDIVIGKYWRVMAGIQALNGIMLIGWSTAVLMAVAQRLWRTQEDKGD